MPQYPPLLCTRGGYCWSSHLRTQSDNKPCTGVVCPLVTRAVPGTCYQAATCPVARQRLGRDKAGQCGHWDAAGDRLPVNTPPLTSLPPPAIVLLIPPTSTLPTLLSPMGARHRVPSGQCPHSRRDNVLTCGGGAVGGAAGGRGSSQTLAGRVETQTRDTALSHRAGTQAV